MSSFSIIPPEILECITYMITASEQMRLWQCGDRILNIKLKNGGLKRTSLCWSSSSWMPWPSTYFRTLGGIEELEWSCTLGTSLCPTLELNLLPRTLKHLYLRCNDIFLILRKLNANMSELFPELRTLHLKGSRLKEKNLKNLPSNLIELFVDSHQENVESSTLFRDMPRHIQILELSFRIEDQEELENDLPTELLSLSVRQLRSKFNWFSKLPRSLKKLRILPEFTPDWLTLPQLEELDLMSFSFSPSVLPQLPQSLRIFEALSFHPKLSDDDISLLPKNLTRFKSWGAITHSGLQRLPSNISDFEAGVSATHPDILSFFNPEAIRISLIFGAYSKQLKLSAFPVHLRYLRIHFIDDNICGLLPDELLELRIDDGILTGKSKFPKSLQLLSIYLDILNGTEAMSHLRFIPNLKLLARFSGQKVNESSIWDLLPSSSSQINRSPEYSSDVSSEMGENRHVRSLEVKCGNWKGKDVHPYLERPFFECLRKFALLTTLVIRQDFGTLPTACIGYLPQSVTTLNIRHLRHHPTAEELYLLPKCLKYLIVVIEKSFKCDWNDETLGSLPRSLQEFKINGNFPNLTPRMVEYLPPYLQVMKTYQDAQNFEHFVTPLDRIYGCLSDS